MSRLSAHAGSEYARGYTKSPRRLRQCFFWRRRWEWEFTRIWWVEHVQRLLPIDALPLRGQPGSFFVLRDRPTPGGIGRAVLRDQNREGVHGFDRGGRNGEDSGPEVSTGTARQEPCRLRLRV